MDIKKTVFHAKKLLLEKHGASAIEYAILGSLVAAVIVLAVVALGTQTQSLFCTFVSRFGGSC